MTFELKNDKKDAIFVPEDAIEKEMAKALSDMCAACINHGGDRGGPYFSFPDEVISKGTDVAEKVSYLLSHTCRGFTSGFEYIEEETKVNAEEFEHSLEANANMKKGLVEKIFRNWIRPYVHFDTLKYTDGTARVRAVMLAFRAVDKEG